MKADAKPRVLCVDDDPRVLESLTQVLRRRFRVSTAVGGESGLELLEQDGPFAIVLSDMRMPAMDGAEFLARVRAQAPDTVRMLLTGYADVESATAAVNRGRIFRFLTKPYPPDLLIEAFQAAAEQHRLVTAERELLEKTLRSTVKVLSDVLALVNPIAFGRASRIQRLVRDVLPLLGREHDWEIDVSAMLSQLGLAAVPGIVLDKLHQHQPLTAEETRMIRGHPEVGRQLIAPIPRLEAVAENIAAQQRRYDGSGAMHEEEFSGPPPFAARLLKIVADFDTLFNAGGSCEEALQRMAERKGWYDPEILTVFKEFVKQSEGRAHVRRLALKDLEAGMVTHDGVRTKSGLLLLAKGQEITPTLLWRLRGFRQLDRLAEPVEVMVPSEKADSSDEVETYIPA